MRNEINYEEITVEKVIKNSPDRYDNTERVLLIDTDSLLYICTYFKEKDLEFYPTKELQLEEVKYRIRNKLQEIQNNVELWYNIKQTFLFVGGGNNFRYKLFKKYKGKRPQEKPEFFYEAKDYLLELGAVPSVGCEVDDMIYEASLIANENCIISTIDKDLLYWIPESIIYSYKGNESITGEWKCLNEKEARLKKAYQCVCGDPGDGIKGAKGVGEMWCKTNLHMNMSDFQFVKSILKAYIKAHKGDVKEAKKDLKLNYKLLRLWTQNEIKALNLI